MTREDPDSGAPGREPLSSNSRFRVNTPLVASEVIDGEAVLIHFETGCYYSAGRLGAEILSLTEAGSSLGQIVGDLLDRYDVERGHLEEAVRRFVGQLREEDLVVAEPPPDEEAASPRGPRSSPDPPVGKRAFEAPDLQKYTDLEDLLLLDPIHDADEAGWPVAKPDPDDR